MAWGSCPHPVGWFNRLAVGCLASVSRDQTETLGRERTPGCTTPRVVLLVQRFSPEVVMQRTFTHPESRRSTRRLRSLIILGALSAVLLAGCGSGGASSTSTVGIAGGGARPQGSFGANESVPAVAPVPSAVAGPAQVPKIGPAVSTGPKLTKTASLGLQVQDIDAAAAQVRSIAAALQAQVLSEQIGSGSPGGPVPLENRSTTATGFGTVTLSVPADSLDTVLQRTLSSQDVTAQYIDTDSRLQTMHASVARVRALMVQAKDIGQVVALEGELSQREADLESLESQLAALKNSVERSSLTIWLSTPENTPVTHTGFVAGLRSGWDAFTASLSGLLTAIGAVLPFAAVSVLVAAALWRLLRRRRERDKSAQELRSATDTGR